MRTILHKKTKTIVAVLLTAVFALSFMNFAGFAVTPDAENGKNMKTTARKADLPSSAGMRNAVAEIVLAANTQLALHENLDGVANQYVYTDENYDEHTGTFSADTSVLCDVPDSYCAITILGNVTIQRMAITAYVAVQFESESTLNLQAKDARPPLEAGQIEMYGPYGETSKVFITGTPNSNNYDVVVGTWKMNTGIDVTVAPNAVLVKEQLSLFGPSNATFKVGASLPLGEVSGVNTKTMELHGKSTVTVESTDLPENALTNSESMTMYPGILKVTGGSKNAILSSGHSIMISSGSSVYAKATAPGSTGMLRDTGDAEGAAGVNVSSSEIYAEGGDYGMKVAQGGMFLSGSMDWETGPIGESTFKGSVAALFVKGAEGNGLNLYSHKVNAILTNDNPNALAAIYFDPNNSSAQLHAASDTTINAVSENKSFQGAAITVVDSFVPQPWAKTPIALFENAQMHTTMPAHQGAPLWAIKASEIGVQDPNGATITHTYTDKVTVGRTPSFPYDASYNITGFQWITDPAGANITVEESGFSTLADVDALALSGTTTTLPEGISGVGNIEYRVTYNTVRLVATVQAVITLDPMGGEVQGGSIEAVVGEAIGVLPVPTHPTNQFLGWFTEKDGQGEEVSESYVVTDTTTLYAFWKTPDPETTLPEMTTVPIETTTSVVETTTGETGGTNPVDPPSAGDKGLAVTATVLALGVCAIILFRKKEKNIVE